VQGHLAHPGIGKEPHHGLLCPQAHPRTRNGETPPWWSSPTGMTSTGSSSPPSPGAVNALRQIPVQAESRAHLRNLLSVPSGESSSPPSRNSSPTTGTTSTPPSPTDEHRGHRRRGPSSQYDFLDGYARHMRDALPVPASSASPEHPSRPQTRTPRPSSENTSASTTSSKCLTIKP
jgi:hypothetical protein